jgi:GTP-binding protein
MTAMRARSARYLTAASRPDGLPEARCPEIAFLGRSNVGKSSLINTLCGHKGLARTSGTPGRTRQLNWFEVEPPRGPKVAFVDLPGYGYAKVARELRASWRALIEAYLGRPALRAAVILLDPRRAPAAEEAELGAWLAKVDVPVIWVATKIDKLAKARRKPALAALGRALGLSRPPLPFAAPTGAGASDLWRAILETL